MFADPYLIVVSTNLEPDVREQGGRIALNPISRAANIPRYAADKQ